MLFKTERIEREFNDERLSPNLRNVLIALDNFCQFNFGKQITLTEIWRSDEEQAEIYPDKPDKKSVHQYWRGGDVRVWGFSKDEISMMENFVNVNFPYADVKFKSCLVHEIKVNDESLGIHFHIQVKS